MRKSKPPDEKTPQGTPDQPGQGAGDPPKYVTEEQLNRAISARFGDFQKKLDKQVEGLTTTIVGKLEELVVGKLEGLKPQAGTGAGTGDGKPSNALDIDNHPKVKGLEKTLQELKTKAEQAEAAATAEKANARAQTLRSTLSERLTKGGVDPKFVRQAAGVLLDVDKRVRWADDEGDEIVFKDATGDVDLETGLKSWLKTDDAKIYLPPRGTQGAGDRGQGKQTQNGQQQQSAGSVLLGQALGQFGQTPNNG